MLPHLFLARIFHSLLLNFSPTYLSFYQIKQTKENDFHERNKPTYTYVSYIHSQQNSLSSQPTKI